MSQQLHIVCLDVPWPADYGGAIDMLNRIRMFKKAGVAIHLHYFSYNERGTPNELNQFCEQIHVYERKTGRSGVSARLPYIVASRINEDLVTNLNRDKYPVLLEGLHCTGILSKLDLQDRKVVVRMHNDEAAYYRELARAEPSLWKKIFFRRESKLIRRYTRQLPDECTYACITPADVKELGRDGHLHQISYLPAFPSWQKVSGEEGAGSLCLYHGNLSVPENEEAALWLLRNVFNKVKKPFVIAGKKPSKRLEKMAHFYQHTCLVADPSDHELNDLIRKAHINILPCFNRHMTGMRLKLLHVLYEGRHCLVNEPMVRETGLEGACHIASSADAFASVIMQLYHQPFTQEEIRLRQQLLGDTYNNERNMQQLIQYLW
ncbi:MAG TPA: mannosyltransferase [Chitinophagaceae bacterium]|nr:mannosyltransferase [Chitinophagaceae bacterium]HRG92435.1 mannosyltransferase [Chitinophagaceae bacterium]